MTDANIEKAESHSKLKTPGLTEYGSSKATASGNFIQDARKRELAMPLRFRTFCTMMEDDAIFNSVDLTNAMVTMSLSQGEYKSTGTANSDKLTKFLNYNIRNMEYGTWLEAMNNASTDLVNGFALQNIVMGIRQHGPFKGQRCLRKLSPRPVSSLYGWVWNKNNSEVVGIIQQPALISSRSPNFSAREEGIKEASVGKFEKAGYPLIPIHNLLHFKYNATGNNPQGDSPLVHCFDSYVEKKMIEQYELSGLAKDLGGIMVIRSPSELFEAAKDTASDAFKEKQAMEKNAADIHAGMSQFIHLLSDTDENGKYLYDFNLKGIDGGGKQYKTSDIIDQKRRAIYSVFGTQSVLLGSDGGSNSLAESQDTTFRYYVERNVMQKEDVLNNQLAPRILAENDIFVGPDDMPKYEAINPYKSSYEEVSKFIQRVSGAGKMTPAMMNFIIEDLGMPTEGIDELDYSQDAGTARVGESDGTSGTGSTQAGGGSDASSVNSDNKG